MKFAQQDLQVVQKSILECWMGYGGSWVILESKLVGTDLAIDKGPRLGKDTMPDGRHRGSVQSPRCSDTVVLNQPFVCRKAKMSMNERQRKRVLNLMGQEDGAKAPQSVG